MHTTTHQEALDTWSAVCCAIFLAGEERQDEKLELAYEIASVTLVLAEQEQDDAD